MHSRVSVLLVLLCLLLAGIPVVGAQDAPLKVVATFSILGDFVQQVAGDNVELTVLVGPDSDSHTYEPTPQDLVLLSEADLIFENGLEFETWLDDLYEASGSTAVRIEVSAGIEPLAFAGHEHAHEDEHAHDEHEDEEHGHDHDDEHAHEEEGHHHDDHDHAAEITDLSAWDGSSISIWALSQAELQPAIDAILAATPELTLEDILTYIEDGNYTAFDTFTVEGQSVTFASDDGSATCLYVFVGETPVVEYPTESWYLFATSDEVCADYRYLLLMPPHAAEAGSIPHYHMRYGATDLAGLIAQGAPWYPSLYPADANPADITNSWVVNARLVGLYIATAYGIDVEFTADEIAAQEAAAAAPVIDVELAPRRLLVADGVESRVSVIDLATGDVLATHDLSAVPTLYTSPSGRYGFAVQADGNVVNVIDSGVELEAHGDHYHTHLETPALLDFALEGPTPIHFVIHDGQIVVFTDGDGAATLFTEANITDVAAEMPRFVAEAPHHGVGVALDDVVLLSHFDPNGEGLPNGVDVLALDGTLLHAFDGCDQLHGEAVTASGAAFACEQGVLVIERDGDAFAARTIAYPAEARAWSLFYDHHSPYLFGDYGDTALVRINVTDETSDVIEFTEAVWQVAFHPDNAEKLLVLTVDGVLHSLDVATGADEGSVAVVEAFTLPEQWGDPRPVLATLSGHALISDPVKGLVHVVHLDGLEVEHSYEIGGTPVNLAAFGFAPVQSGHSHDHEHEDEHDHAHDEHDEHGHHHGEFDPHVWHDPNNAVVMVENIRDALVAADAVNAADYEANAAAYIAQLGELDAYIREAVAAIPEANRVLITSHDTFGYFADEYGFVVDSVLESVSTEAADPSAGAMAALVTEIRESGVPAIFAENIANPALVEQIASEAGVAVAPTLYTDALGQAGTAGENYLSLVRYNVETIATALGGQN